MLGDLQTIGPLGVLLHSRGGISRGSGEDLLCSGRRPGLSRGRATLLLPPEDGRSPLRRRGSGAPTWAISRRESIVAIGVARLRSAKLRERSSLTHQQSRGCCHQEHEHKLRPSSGHPGCCEAARDRYRGPQSSSRRVPAGVSRRRDVAAGRHPTRLRAERSSCECSGWLPRITARSRTACHGSTNTKARLRLS
jgi:hypothetical protein